MVRERYWKISGFTLVEVLVVLVITGILGTGIMSLYINSSKAYETQTLIGEAQQNVRAGLDAIVWDIRMAGYDPTREADAGFVLAGNKSLQFTMDVDDNAGTGAPDGDLSDPEEDVIYRLFDVSGNNHLIRDLSPPNPIDTDIEARDNAVAEYIEDIAFAYAFDSNDDGELDVDAGGRIHWAVIQGGNWWELDADGDDQITAADDTDGDNSIDAVNTGIAADLDDIRAVKIWLLARTPRGDRNPAPDTDFVVGDTVFQATDGMRRRLLTTSVVCKNMGI